MMKSSAMFVSLLVMGESPACTGSNNPMTSVASSYSGSDLRETVEAKMDSFTSEAETTDVTGSGLESMSCLGEVIHQERAGSHSELERLR